MGEGQIAMGEINGIGKKKKKKVTGDMREWEKAWVVWYLWE